MAIQDDNTVLKKADLKAYHEAIAPMLGGSFMLSTNVSDYYSTDEKVIGVWLDGKPLYQKTYFTNDLENATTLQTKNISAGFPLNNRPERIISTVGCWRVGSNPYTGGTIPYVDDNYVMNAQLSGSQGYIQILYKGDWRNTDVYITLQYTKIGDTATSALTTPGAYDLNRPDLWPTNKEIFFGNGLYGYRATGRATSSSVTLGTFTSSLKIYSCGGYLLADSGWELQLGYGVPSSNGCGLVKNPSGNLILDVHTQYVNGSAYNIWVTYTK